MVNIYSWGLIYLSVCTDETIEATTVAVNMSHPTGIESQWALADEPFRTGETNPHPCKDTKDAQHMLFSC